MNKPFSTVFIPPMIDGVSASKVFLPLKSQANTIYEHLTQQFPHINANEWMQRFEDGLVYTTHGQKLRVDSIYEGNQHIYYYRFLPKETPVPFEHHILHETDEFLVVVNRISLR